MSMNTKDSSQKIYCHCEPGAFPANQFLMNENGELLLPYVHSECVEYAHYVTGVPYDGAFNESINKSNELAKESSGLVFTPHTISVAGKSSDILEKLANLSSILFAPIITPIISKLNSLFGDKRK